MLAKAGEVTVGEELGAKKDDQHQVEQPPLQFLNPRKVFGIKHHFKSQDSVVTSELEDENRTLRRMRECKICLSAEVPMLTTCHYPLLSFAKDCLLTGQEQACSRIT